MTYQDSYADPKIPTRQPINRAETARLIVGGVIFEDWVSVYVQHRWQEGWPTFRFTAAEGAEQPFDYAKLQFKPGDPCQIELGGELAVTGIITQRQVAYAGTEHGVQLSGVGKQWGASTSSVPSENNQNNFDNQDATAIFTRVMASVKGSGIIIGTVDPQPFKVMQSQPGELVFDFLDRVARMRNATLGSDHLGNLLLIGEHSSPIVQQLTEGFNILKMQAIFSNELMYSIYKLTGQFKVQDDRAMRAAAQVIARARGNLVGLERFLEIPTEHPSETPEEQQKRATYEALRRDGTQLKCNVTVQGWLRDGEQLWRTGDNVMIFSPMVPINLGMKIQTATFTQDSKGGTTTLLECVLPWMLGDRLYQLTTPPRDAPLPADQQPVPT